jgi:hypothetical protein
MISSVPLAARKPLAQADCPQSQSFLVPYLSFCHSHCFDDFNRFVEVAPKRAGTAGLVFRD